MQISFFYLSLQSKIVTTTKNKKIMAFKAGNKARKKESAAQTTESIDLSTLEYCVGQYTRNIDKCCMDRLRAAVYYHLNQDKSKDYYSEEELEEEIKKSERKK